MRAFIKRQLARLVPVPVLGRLVLVGRSVWRGPVDSARLDEVSAQVATLGGPGGQSLRDALDALLRTVAELNERQLAIDADRDGLARSVPVALRRLQRAADEAADRRAELERTVEDAGRRLEDHAGTLTYLLERVEFVRSELLFETRYGARREAVRPGADVVTATKVKTDPSAWPSPVRVNLGCGHVPLEGYVNVDNRDLPGVDVVADVTALPFEDHSCAELFSAHFLEHFPREELRRVVLPALVAKLAPDGVFRAVVPDIDAMMREYVAGRWAYDDLQEVVYGGQDYDGDFHYAMFTPESLSALLHEAGLVRTTVIERARVNGRSLELEIEARRG